MKNAALSFFLLFMPLWISPVLAEDIREIQWQDLIPTDLQAADPLVNLSEEDQGMVNWILYMRETMPKEISPEDQELVDQMNRAIPDLKAKGIDIDKVSAWRRELNTSIAPELDGKKIRLAGYLLPLDVSGNSVKEFLLVPYVGACIHVPPPPPNQIVHVIMGGKTVYSSDKLFDPVAVTGVLTGKSATKGLFLSDGSDDVSIGYTMDAQHVESYMESSK